VIARRRPASLKAVWLSRLPVVAEALGRSLARVHDEASFAAALGELIDARNRSEVWLALAVLTGRLPSESLVLETARSAEFDPGALVQAVRRETTRESAMWNVVVEREKTLVDVGDTATSALATGIQRVVREVSKRWMTIDTVRLTGWTTDWQSLRDLGPSELVRVERARARSADEADEIGGVVVVPWQTTYVLLEVSAEPVRSDRLRALARFSGSETAALCYDLIPVTSSETSSPGMTGVFAHYMAALKYFDRLSTISRATAVEYMGWTEMLPAAGVLGPEITPVLLPASVGDADEESLATARERLIVGGMPLVLVVGSHEPRKNHLAILHAAEVLWREGQSFSLTFIGSRSWRGEEYHDRLRQLQNQGRPVESFTHAGDSLLWASYRLARFTVFPSLNEGFGLPVAESLAVGTPVVTSGFGSTAEIAEHGGAILVDPRDDDDLTSAMRTLLSDDATLQRLQEEAQSRPQTSWDQYSRDLWESMLP
jgi:glycosyltransferase involved in cell wall biosynthesis